MKIARFLAWCALAAVTLELTTSSYATTTVTAVATVADLRSLSPLPSQDSQVLVAGYYSDNDQGGGLFVAGASGSCQTASFAGTISSTDLTQITTSYGGTLTPGMKITAAGYLPPGDTIGIVNGTLGSYTLTLAVAATSAGSPTFAVSSDNGGNQVCDSTQSVLYTRIHSNYGPKEWGAFLGNPNLTMQVALQNWLYSGQPHIGDVGDYKIAGPLTCPANTTIQGPANVSADSGTPAFRIYADKDNGKFPTSLLSMNDYCRITGVALDAKNVLNLDTIDVLGTHVAIDGHSLIENAGNYNISCGGGAIDQTRLTGLQIKDSQIIMATSDNVHSTCPNMRVIGNIISGAGAAGSPANDLYAGGSDATIANNAIEQSFGNGLNVQQAQQVKVVGNFFDSDGKCTYTSGSCDGAHIASLRIATSEYVNVTGNSFHRSDLGLNFTGGEHVLFDSSHVGNYGIVFSGNTYFPDADSNGAGGKDGAIHPDYVYGVASSSVSMVNTTLYERPAMQNMGIYGPGAQAILGGFVSPVIWKNYITGLTLSKVDGTHVQIDTGEASDSTNAALIKADSTCTVNLGTNGDKGLDTGTFTSGVTYFFYLISTAEGANPSCIASALPTGPLMPPLPASPLTASVDTTTNVSQINVQTGTNWPTGIVQGQTISNAGIPSCGIPSNTTIIDVNTTFAVLSNEITLGASPCSVNIQGAYTLYRPVGALYAVTISGSAAIVDFTQDDDTFYLTTSVMDIDDEPTGGGGLGNSSKSYQLASVPNGIKVEAFGRCVGGSSSNHVFMRSPDQGDQQANVYSTAPGYTVSSVATSGPTFPFRLYTNATRGVKARAFSSTQLQTFSCMTDGWVWHRGK